ncbi:MAG TPA: hypothetical protein VK689_19255, partial [Armatimonadota bacterium]|nr:hypothetical protein [Armatimonadota bacterium]
MRIASSSWKTRLGLTCLGLGLVFNSLSAVGAQGGSSGRHMVAPPETPIQLRDSVGIRLVETTNLIRAGEARTRFGVSGAGLAVAVIDSGLRTTHLDFA